MPVAADEPMKVPSTDFIPQGRPQSAIVRKLIEKLMKPKPPLSIPSGTISTEQRDGALAPFTMTGVAVGRVNRDYDAFFKTAWNSSPTSAPKTSSCASNLPQPPVPSAALVQPSDSPAESELREEKVNCNNIGYHNMHMHGVINKIKSASQC